MNYYNPNFQPSEAPLKIHANAVYRRRRIGALVATAAIGLFSLKVADTVINRDNYKPDVYNPVIVDSGDTVWGLVDQRCQPAHGRDLVEKVVDRVLGPENETRNIVAWVNNINDINTNTIPVDKLLILPKVESCT